MSTFTQHIVAEVAAAAGLDGSVHYFDQIDSTNAEALRLAESGAPQWTLVVADHQEAGRGRLGRRWVSPPGDSLLVSVLVRPAVEPRAAALVTLAAGACMARACAEACGVAVRCKWPNDLVVAGRKLGGILVEARVEGALLAHAVIGAGVNVQQSHSDFPEELLGRATSVAMEGGRPDRRELLLAYLTRMRREGNPSEPGFGPGMLEIYGEVSDTIGRNVRATTTAGRTLEGRALGIGPTGELLVETEQAAETVAFGEIEHLD